MSRASLRKSARSRSRKPPPPASRRSLFGWALATGQKHRDEVAAGRTPTSLSWKLANALVFKKLKAGFGGRVRYAIAGGAPLGLDTAHWFASAGIRILEGYGLTETSPVIALNTPNANRMGSVGKPLPNVECRIAADGELLVRGPSIFPRLLEKSRRRRQSIDAEGWFPTGDIGHIDPDGFLYITDRKKELLKTSGGKFIAPQPIENKLKASFLVGNAAVVGDRHKFASAIIAPNFAALEPWAKEQGITAAIRHISSTTRRSGPNSRPSSTGSTPPSPTLKPSNAFASSPTSWALDSGELTPSMKLRRRIVTQKYAREIAEFYSDENTSTR